MKEKVEKTIHGFEWPKCGKDHTASGGLCHEKRVKETIFCHIA